MHPLNSCEIDWTGIDERRRLARLRQERDQARRVLLENAMQSARQAMQLRHWIAAMTQHADAQPELSRMLAWARMRLAELEATASPERLGAALREHDVFPAVDELHDPLGEPPARQAWGR